MPSIRAFAGKGVRKDVVELDSGAPQIGKPRIQAIEARRHFHGAQHRPCEHRRGRGEKVYGFDRNAARRAQEVDKLQSLRVFRAAGAKHKIDGGVRLDMVD